MIEFIESHYINEIIESHYLSLKLEPLSNELSSDLYLYEIMMGNRDFIHLFLEKKFEITV